MIVCSRQTARNALFLSTAMFAAAVATAAVPTRFSVSGAVTAPATYDAAALAALPQVTQADTFLSGNSSQTHVYSGPGLWAVVNNAGVVSHSAVKNDVLNRYVLATGSDGYRTVFSLGELSPDFGNRPDLVATTETISGVASHLGADGFARVTAPGDVKGGRYVSNLVDLAVRSSASSQAATGGGVTTQFSVSGTVAVPMAFTLGALRALPRITETVGGHSYAGASFWDLLDATVGLSTDPAVKNDVLSRYVVATGSDGYKALFSLGELDTAFGNQPDLIAYEEDGAPLSSDGFARIVVPDDVRAGRWVSNLTSLEVFSAAPVPEPQTCALMLVGLIFTGWGATAGSALGRPRHFGLSNQSGACCTKVVRWSPRGNFGRR